ncbi:MAG: tryptophan synthase subunit alpha [Gammaproteobacteria bacterium]
MNGGGRIAAAFGKARAENRAAMIPFITAGYPAADSTVPMLTALAESGADIIELGVPFSDPSADGPAIARASEKALANGITLQKILQQIGAFRQTDKKTPVVLMGYANSFFRCGREKFMTAAKQNGADGLIVVDFSDDERPLWRKAGQAAGVDVISLVAPTTSPERQMQLAGESAGFVYFIALKGITGAHHLSVDALAPRIGELKKAAKTPVAVGFGIRDAAQARQLAKCADGIVVGSRLTEVIEESPKQDAAKNVAAVVGELAGAVR